MLITVLFIISLALAATNATADEVSGISGKLEVMGGNVDGNSTRGAAGSLNLPIVLNYGAQIDAAAGEIGDKDVKGAALHLFWRNPSLALLGATFCYAEYRNYDIARYGLEGEYYAGRFTVAAAAGYLDIDKDVDDGAYGSLNLRWYARDNLMLEIGGSTAEDSDQSHIGVEFQPFNNALSGLTLFVDAATGNYNYDHLLGGIRYYFGAKKTLIRRHREDDPINPVFRGVLGSMGPINNAAGGGGTSSTGNGGMTQIDPPPLNHLN